MGQQLGARGRFPLAARPSLQPSGGDPWPCSRRQVQNVPESFFLLVSGPVFPPLTCLHFSPPYRGLENLCLQVTDLLPGLRRMQSVLPEHGCLLVSPGNYWQNRRDVFDSDPDILKTVQQHEPKGLHTSATLKGDTQEVTSQEEIFILVM